jgi:hypothetical protein
MKTMETTVLVFFVMAIIGCRERPHDKTTRMMLDSAASGDNVTIVRPKEAVGPAETIKDLKGLPTIMQSDRASPPGRLRLDGRMPRRLAHLPRGHGGPLPRCRQSIPAT